MTKTSPNFAPDGMARSSHQQQPEIVTMPGSKQSDAQASSHSSPAHNERMTDHDHFYDDGLVHSHSWAVSSPDR
jgi:hypothetical protein